MDERVKNSMKVPELKEYIRLATKEVNMLINDEDIPSIETEKIKKDVISRKGKEIGLGFRGKTKKELFIQARALQDYIDARERESGYDDWVENNYRSFMAGAHGVEGLSFENYKELANLMGTMGEDLKKSFEYGYYSAYGDYIDKIGTENITRIIIDLMEDKKGKGMQQMDMEKELKNRLKEFYDSTKKKVD